MELVKSLCQRWSLVEIGSSSTLYIAIQDYAKSKRCIIWLKSFFFFSFVLLLSLVSSSGAHKLSRKYAVSRRMYLFITSYWFGCLLGWHLFWVLNHALIGSLNGFWKFQFFQRKFASLFLLGPLMRDKQSRFLFDKSKLHAAKLLVRSCHKFVFI